MSAEQNPPYECYLKKDGHTCHWPNCKCEWVTSPQKTIDEKKTDRTKEVLDSLIKTHLVIPQKEQYWFQMSVKTFSEKGKLDGSLRDAVVSIAKDFCRAIIEQEQI